MARIRTIKPDFFMHEGIAELPVFARLLFIGLFTQADRRGRMEDRPRRLKAALLPYDDVDINELLDVLHDGGFIVRYQVDDLRLIQVAKFEKHQRFTGDEAKAESKLPEYQPPMKQEADKKQERNTEETREETESSTQETGKGKEGKGIGKESSSSSLSEELPTEVADQPPEKETMTLKAFAECYRPPFGVMMPPLLNQKALEYCQFYTPERITDAFITTAERGGKSFEYFKSCLEGLSLIHI